MEPKYLVLATKQEKRACQECEDLGAVSAHLLPGLISLERRREERPARGQRNVAPGRPSKRFRSARVDELPEAVTLKPQDGPSLPLGLTNEFRTSELT
jgi:hypothetical protein